MNPHEMETFFEKHSNYIRFLAFSYFPFSDYTDDLVHDIYIEFVQKESAGCTEEEISSVLRTIARAVSKQYWKHKYHARFDVIQRVGLRLAKIVEEKNELPDPDNEIASLQDCVERLPSREKDLIDLFYFQKWTCIEISEKAKVDVNVVYQRISRIRRKLAECVRRKAEI